MHLVDMTAAFAAEIVTWRYPEPYQRYDLAGADPAYFTDPANGFYAVVQEEAGLVGYRSFGPDGRVPGGTYDDTALDTGGGLRPDLTGQGRGVGRAAIASGLAFGRERWDPPAFRVTVAASNGRALHVVRSLGFRRVDSFAATTDGSRYEILRLDRPSE